MARPRRWGQGSTVHAAGVLFEEAQSGRWGGQWLVGREAGQEARAAALRRTTCQVTPSAPEAEEVGAKASPLPQQTMDNDERTSIYGGAPRLTFLLTHRLSSLS